MGVHVIRLARLKFRFVFWGFITIHECMYVFDRGFQLKVWIPPSIYAVVNMFKATTDDPLYFRRSYHVRSEKNAHSLYDA